MTIGVYNEQFDVHFGDSAGLDHDAAIPDQCDVHGHGFSFGGYGYGHLL